MTFGETDPVHQAAEIRKATEAITIYLKPRWWWPSSYAKKLLALDLECLYLQGVLQGTREMGERMRQQCRDMEWGNTWEE